MSQQLQITGGAKVRSLEGVITGSTGVLGSLPINGANGIPQLDSNGKILVSQLPNSVMEYKGTWNVTTNTPYLVNGTGNTGDVYLVEGAATGGTSHDFGAGAITFYNGDQVIYSGSIWQRGAGSSGTVTSVAITESGDALTITGSPITNSGTINIGFAGTSAQYVAGNGTLVTFPTITTEAQRLITEVYNETGATLTKGTVVYINGGHGNLPTIAKALATSDATSAQTYGVVQSDIGNNNNGYVVVIGSLTNLDTQAYANGTQLYLSSTTAGAWTSTKQYAPAHLVYVGIVTRSHPTQGVVEIKIQNGYELDELHNVSAQNPWQDDGLFYNYYTQLWENKPITSALGYTPVPNTRTLTINGVTYDLTANRSWTIATGISGSGTTNYIPKFTGSTSVGNSSLQELSAGWLQLGSSSINTSELDIEGNTGAKVFLYDGFGSATIQSYYNDAFTILTQVSGQTTNVIDYNYATKTLSFQTNGNNTRLNITSSGNIGIGNTNDTYKLDVTGTGRFSGQLTLGSTITNGTYTYTLPGATGTLALLSDIPSVTNFVTLNTLQTIIGTKIYSSLQYFDNNVYIKHSISGSSSGYTTLGASASGLNINLASGTSNNSLLFASTSASNTYTFPNATGTIALTTDLSSYVPTSRTLTINGTTYDLSANRSWTVSGSQWTTSGSDIYYNTGNVGINQSSPTYKLDVSGTGRFTSSLIAASFSTPSTGLSGSTTWNFYHDQYAAGDFGLWAGGTNRILINAAGNVGIGTSSPSERLSIAGTGGLVGMVRWTDSAIASAFLGITTGGVPYIHSNNFSLAFGANGSNNFAETMRITGGNVGIGTSSPSQPLHVYATSTTTSSYFETSSANSYIGLKSTSGVCYIGNVGYALTFEAGGSERMRITSGGNVLIGTTTAIGSPFQVQGNTWLENASAVPQYLNRTGNDGGLVVFLKAGVQVGVIATNTYTLPSDLNFKKNILDIDLGLNLVSKLRPVSYNHKIDDEDAALSTGFIAQELEKSLTELGVEKNKYYLLQHIPNEKEGESQYWVDYQKFIPVLVKAIQELEARLKTLENK